MRDQTNISIKYSSWSTNWLVIFFAAPILLMSNDGQFDYWEQRPSKPTYAPQNIQPIPAQAPVVEPPQTAVSTSNAKIAPASDEFYDDLDVYESDEYSIESQQQAPDNDVYYYSAPGTVYAPLPPSDGDLDVYENPNFKTQAQELYVPYNPYIANGQPYQALPSNPNNEQSRTLYEPIHPEQYNDYKPERDFWPDYYDY
jgi:hypothetical protein